MININRVVIVGRLTKDIDLRKTPSNKSTCTFTVASERRFKQEGQQEADFISCVAWNQSADFLSKYAHKGTIVGIEGRLATRSYDGKDGNKVYVTEVICDSVSLISSDSKPKQEEQPKVSSEDEWEDNYVSPTNSPNLDISSDDLPFY